jgi:hypothetical protein
MKPLTLNLLNAPGAMVVVNSLYDSKDPGFLVQDLVLVELPGMTYIDVSWFPEHDPSGAYTVSVFRGHEQIAELETREPFDAVRIVEKWASDLSQGVAAVAGPAIAMRLTPDGGLGPSHTTQFDVCDS